MAVIFSTQAQTLLQNKKTEEIEGLGTIKMALNGVDAYKAVLHLIPLLILVLLMGLELDVVLIQTYVFTILTYIYLNNARQSILNFFSNILYFNFLSKRFF